MMSEELFEQAKWHCCGRTRSKQGAAGRYANSLKHPSNIADIQRKLANSRMRCSCSAFDTLLVATAREKHRPLSGGVVPSDDRGLTVLHRREGGPSSIYFAPASQAACDPVPVRRAEHFGIGGGFSH
jgi:hypothetical protein